MKNLLIISAVCLHVATSSAQPNCTAAPSGFIPINDLGVGTFNGWTGGLYPNGSNTVPAAHLQAGLQLGAQVLPRDTAGNVDLANGKIVWLSVGMSNATQETQRFIPLVNAYPNKNPKLILVDGAQGGMTAGDISTPSLSDYNTYWTTVNTRLSNAGVSTKQVQVIWLKEANPAGSTPVQTYYDSLVVQFKRIANELKMRFPNARLCYMASRISGRYASSALNPEPYAYYTGWAVKKVIADQVSGDPQLQYFGAVTNAPWLSWGIYMWSDGSTPQNSDTSIYWNCPADFQNDGTHPSTAGEDKVANLLLKFYQNDLTACSWFFNTPPLHCAQLGISELVVAKEAVSNYPNPFSTSTTIRIDKDIIAKYGHASCHIYNTFGSLVRKIENISSNEFFVTRGEIPGGIYFYRVIAATSSTVIGSGKLIVK